MGKMFERDIRTQVLIDALSKCPIGEIITYQEMTELIGERVGGGHPAYQSAISILLNDQGIDITTIRKIGAKREPSEGTIAKQQKNREGIRRRSKKGLTQLESVEYDTLSEPSKVSWNLNTYLHRLVANILSPKSVKVIGSKPMPDTRMIPEKALLNQYIDAMKRT